MSPQQTIERALTQEQRTALQNIATRYNTTMAWEEIMVGVSGLPSDWVLCQVGPIVVGVSPAGEISS